MEITWFEIEKDGFSHTKTWNYEMRRFVRNENQWIRCRCMSLGGCYGLRHRNVNGSRWASLTVNIHEFAFPA